MTGRPDSDVERALKAFGDLSLKYRSFGAMPLRIGSAAPSTPVRSLPSGSTAFDPVHAEPGASVGQTYSLLGQALGPAAETSLPADWTPRSAAPAAPPGRNLPDQTLASQAMVSQKSPPATRLDPRPRTEPRLPLPNLAGAEPVPPQPAPVPSRAAAAAPLREALRDGPQLSSMFRVAPAAAAPVVEGPIETSAPPAPRPIPAPPLAALFSSLGQSRPSRAAPPAVAHD